ncbi:hypothetical protein GKZ89_18465 [Bacillus mangrovi]|uniref:DUF3139 domain-containing protein n=1 Tax=Metabacillus mangrovi TaxID=1491830 RepID=A0A7X2V6P3_9BACI|nr:hypothetical protein [Metabacillus mangrovi]MTH55379.1 hypothetical protein [Metabacillus mangrovi]
MKITPMKIIVAFFVILIMGILLFGPYKITSSIFADNIITDPNLSKEFKDYNITSIDYKGENTYFIKTKTGDFVVIRDYISTMNYKWQVYKFKDELEYK